MDCREPERDGRRFYIEELRLFPLSQYLSIPFKRIIRFLLDIVDCMKRYKAALQIIKGLVFASIGFWYVKDKPLTGWIPLSLLPYSVLSLLDNYVNGYRYEMVTRGTRFSWSVSFNHSSLDHLYFNYYSFVGLYLSVFLFFSYMHWILRVFFIGGIVVLAYNGVLDYRRLKEKELQSE